MTGTNSISMWIASLKDGDAAAAQRLWDRFSARLRDFAQQRLGRTPRGMADEDDIAQSAFHSMCEGVIAGRFSDVRSRDELWWLLLKLTRQKAVNHRRREGAKKRGGGRVHTETALSTTSADQDSFALDQLIGQDPTPEFLVALEEEHQRLLGLLRDDRLREIAILRIEGYAVADVAGRLGISLRSVERKLQLIREVWILELLPARTGCG